MKLKFLGNGGAFAPLSMGQSNAVLEIDDENYLLIDCGTDCRHLLFERYPNLNNQNFFEKLKGCYITHIHADHVGGLEWLGYCTYFNPSAKRPYLIGEKNILKELWENSLSGGMRTVEGGEKNLEDFFNVIGVNKNKKFKIGEKIEVKICESIHVSSDYGNKYNYGMIVHNLEEDFLFYYTGDVNKTNWDLNKESYEKAELIFQDCETTSYKSGVHYHYEDLCELPDDIKSKMYLYHYSEDYINEDPISDGFLGFVSRSETYKV